MTPAEHALAQYLARLVIEQYRAEHPEAFRHEPAPFAMPAPHAQNPVAPAQR